MIRRVAGEWVGKPCLWCEEPMTKGRVGVFRAAISGTPEAPEADVRVLHIECDTRMVVGSVGHLLGRCSCFGGTEEDPPHMTKREAAVAASALALTLAEVKKLTLAEKAHLN